MQTDMLPRAAPVRDKQQGPDWQLELASISIAMLTPYAAVLNCYMPLDTQENQQQEQAEGFARGACDS